MEVGIRELGNNFPRAGKSGNSHCFQGWNIPSKRGGDSVGKIFPWSWEIWECLPVVSKAGVPQAKGAEFPPGKIFLGFPCNSWDFPGVVASSPIPGEIWESFSCCSPKILELRLEKPKCQIHDPWNRIKNGIWNGIWTKTWNRPWNGIWNSPYPCGMPGVKDGHGIQENYGKDMEKDWERNFWRSHHHPTLWCPRLRGKPGIAPGMGPGREPGILPIPVECQELKIGIGSGKITEKDWKRNSWSGHLHPTLWFPRPSGKPGIGAGIPGILQNAGS